MTGATDLERRPCDTCRRVHAGPRCAVRSVKRCVTLPGYVSQQLDDVVPWGDRSSFIASAVERALLEAVS